MNASQPDPVPTAAMAAAQAQRNAAANLYGDDCIERLQKLAGCPCPHCGRKIMFTGNRLFCAGNYELFSECAYGWGDPDGAEAEILGNGPQ